MNFNQSAIATKLNILDSAIIEIQEWASVLFVKFIGGCRFISKKIGVTKIEIKRTMNTWGGDRLILAVVDGETKMIIGRYSRSIEFGRAMAKDVTAQAKGKSLDQMMLWHFDIFHDIKPMTVTEELEMAITSW
jgi:hypothetical protein